MSAIRPGAVRCIDGEVTAASLADAVAHLVTSAAGSAALQEIYLVTVVGRQGGAQRLRRMATRARGKDLLVLAFERAMASAAALSRPPDALQIDVGFPPVRVSAADLAGKGRIRIGRKGLALLRGERLLAATGPSEMIAKNRTFEKALARLLAAQGLTARELSGGLVEPALFDAVQVLFELPQPARGEVLWRGNRVVSPADVDASSVTALADGMVTWMQNQVEPSGRITYKYHPSVGLEPRADNSIRQCMATVCLNRIALQTGEERDRELADRNLEHLLRSYYRQEGGHGFIVEREKAKLGAAALAALAILENPGAARHRESLEALSRTIDGLWQPTGAFRTFFKPAGRNDNQNFYPGEALVFWATRMAGAGGREDPSRFLASFDFYRDHFRRDRNPAFVPWHTQAYFTALPFVPEEVAGALRDFVFEMNDWLLGMQQWESTSQPDLRGRFYDPAHPEYGPPHASSTGVYLEGLIDALELARRLGDQARGRRYRLAILRGLRSLIQLQFRTPIDMFYVTKRSRVFGGIRTEAYDNAIRVDNVQHGLMAVMKIIARLPPAELRLTADGELWP